MAVSQTWGLGRRKTSVARVRVKKGTGIIEVNGKPMNEYFSHLERYSQKIMRTLQVLDVVNKYDIIVNVFGGGLTGQADAIVLAIARALVQENEMNKPVLKRNGLLKRDPRMVERKKFGLRKARRSKQFSKR